MKKIISIFSLILVSFWIILPCTASSSVTDPTELLASLNSKTAKITAEWQGDKKPDGTVTKELTVNSYVFSLDKKQLKIAFSEETKTLEDGKHTETYSIVGHASVDINGIDQKKTVIRDSFVSIACHDDKKCITGKEQSNDFNALIKNSKKEDREIESNMFHIRSVEPPLADQISKDLKALLALVAPPPKPAEKAEITAAEKRKTTP